MTEREVTASLLNEFGVLEVNGTGPDLLKLKKLRKYRDERRKGVDKYLQISVKINVLNGFFSLSEIQSCIPDIHYFTYNEFLRMSLKKKRIR